MNIITQEARRRQGAVKLAIRKGNTFATKMYGVSLSSIKRWRKRYDGTWQSLKERSHKPLTHPARHTKEEEAIILKAFKKAFLRYGWCGVYDEACENGYKRSFSGLVYAANRMGLGTETKRKCTRKNIGKYPDMSYPGEKVQMDVKEVPYNCLKGKIKAKGGHLYQWTIIDECTRLKFVYGYEEHTPENTVDFLRRAIEFFPFAIHTIQTDNGTEFTYKYISESTESPLDKELKSLGIFHKLIPPRTPWHNGKVERSHRNDQKYFYDWEKFRSVDELNAKLEKHLKWSNNRTMRVLGMKSPTERMREFYPEF